MELDYDGKGFIKHEDFINSNKLLSMGYSKDVSLHSKASIGNKKLFGLRKNLWKTTQFDI